jgi:succinoglycan biosynthesis transport protein ExoP
LDRKDPRISDPTPAPGTDLVAALPPAPAHAYESYEHHEEKPMDFRRMFAALGRYKWLVLGCSIAGLAAGVGISRFVPPRYRVQATIWIDIGDPRSQGGSRGQSGPIRPDQLLPGAAWLDLLRSYVVLDTVVSELRLYLSTRPADRILFETFRLKDRFRAGEYRLELEEGGNTFALSIKGAGVIQRGTVGDSVGQELGFAWVPPATALRARRRVDFAVSGPRNTALGLMEAMHASLPLNANFMRLEMDGGDAELAARTLNAIADRFVEVAAHLKREKLAEVTRILREQLVTAQGDLTRAENSLESFRVGTITLPGERGAIAAGLEETRDPVFTRYFEMRIDRENLTRDRQAIERALALPADSGQTMVALEAIASVRDAAELRGALTELTNKRAEARSMRLQFSAEHVPLRRIEDEILELELRTIPLLARHLLAQIAERERELSSRINSASSELQQIPPRVIEQARLRRDVDIADNLYTMLQQRYEESRLAEVSAIPDVRILDQAVPPTSPLKSRAMLFIVAGLMLGLGGSVTGALLLDKIDRRLRYPKQVTDELGVPILGALPRVRRSGGSVRKEDEAQVVEALRTIRLELVHAHGAAGPLVTTVTSPGSGDGKSFLSSNLAMSFADAGHRVLLIDGDIRRGALHRVLGANRKPGLLDYLGGSANRDRIIQKSNLRAVDFIGCGTRKMGGPELLASSAMSQLLISLRTQYSVIIIDSPPLGAGVDPLVLGSLTGSMLLVLRTGHSDRELAAAKLEPLGHLPIRLLGAVLNDVKADGVYRYYSYLPGYTAENEDDAGERPAQRLPAGASS